MVWKYLIYEKFLKYVLVNNEKEKILGDIILKFTNL